MNDQILKPASISESNPQEAIDKATGKYDDAASRLSDEQRLPMLPQAPDPQPFGNMTTPSGGR